MNPKIILSGNLLRQVFDRLGTASLIILANNSLVTLLNFAIMLVLLSALGINGYGIYILLISVISFGEQFSTLGIFPLVVTEISRELGSKNYPKVKTLIYRFTILQAAIGILISAGIFAFSFHAAKEYGSGIASALLLFSLYFLIYPLKNVFNVSFASFLKFHYQAAFTSFELICRLVLLCFAFSFFGANLLVISGVFLVSLLLSLLVASIWFVRLTSFLSKVVREKTNIFFNLLKEVFVYGFITHQIKNIYMNLYPWVINLFLGVGAVAIFAVLQKVVGIFLRLLEPIDESLLPIIASLEESKEERSRLFSRLTKYTLAFGLLLMLASWVAIPFIPLIIGSSFSGNELSFALLTLTLPLYSLVMTVRPILFKEREQKFITCSTFISLLVSFVAGALLMFYFGLIGAAFGYILFQFTHYIIVLSFLGKKYGLSFDYLLILSFDSVDRKMLIESKKILFSFPRRILAKFK